jgi:hypothetical protein
VGVGVGDDVGVGVHVVVNVGVGVGQQGSHSRCPDTILLPVRQLTRMTICTVVPHCRASE